MMAPGADRDGMRERLLFATLPHISFDGWTARAMAAGADDAGIEPAAASLCFPGGPAELIEFFSLWADGRMAAAMKSAGMASSPLHERIARAVHCRIEILSPWREAARRAVGYFALPAHAPMGIRYLYRTIDSIWYAADDRSADFSFYTKRAMLSGIYTATLLYWFEDGSDGYADSWGFLDRRIAEIGRVHRFRARAERMANSVPNPFRVLRPRV